MKKWQQWLNFALKKNLSVFVYYMDWQEYYRASVDREPPPASFVQILDSMGRILFEGKWQDFTHY